MIINYYLKITLTFLFLVILILAASAVMRNEPAQEKISDIPSNNNNNTTLSKVPASNTTNRTPAGPVSIPLEKPPFIE